MHGAHAPDGAEQAAARPVANLWILCIAVMIVGWPAGRMLEVELTTFPDCYAKAAVDRICEDVP